MIFGFALYSASRSCQPTSSDVVNGNGYPEGAFSLAKPELPHDRSTLTRLYSFAIPRTAMSVGRLSYSTCHWRLKLRVRFLCSRRAVHSAAFSLHYTLVIGGSSTLSSLRPLNSEKSKAGGAATGGVGGRTAVVDRPHNRDRGELLLLL